ncbi:MAG: Four helix bundle sensory module for signal transduction [bacterium ADurb.BinA186]|nr:MAG: Four helix bundle sensory module for signal transduction [bacterium ADurb.BinA186]
MKQILKLGAFFTIFIVLFSLFGMVINSQFEGFANLVEDLHDHSMAVMRSASTAALNVVKISRNLKEILLIQDKVEREREIGSLSIYESNIQQELKLVKARITGDEGDDLLAGAMEAIKKWHPVRDKILDLAEQNRLTEAVRHLRAEGDDRLSDVESSITKITNYAVGQGMGFHAGGIQALRKAKIILFVAGFALVLLFVVVGLVIGRVLIRPEYAVRDFLTKITENGLNLSLPFEENDGGTMGKPLLELIALMKNYLEPACEKVIDTQKGLINVIGERQEMLKIASDLEQKSNLINKKSTKLIDDIVPMLDTISTFSSVTKQIENDLAMILQITSSQQLIISSLNAPSEPTKLTQIIEQEKSINDYIKSSIGILSQANSLSLDLTKSLKEISNLSNEQINLGQTIHELRDVLDNITKRLEKIQNKVNGIGELLHCDTRKEPEASPVIAPTA